MTVSNKKEKEKMIYEDKVMNSQKREASENIILSSH
jgi:hypothetical protein